MHDKHFVLARIDVTSRQGDLVWTPNKSGQAVLKAFKTIIFRNGGNFPNKLQTDKGTEFFNKYLRPYLHKNGVNHFASEGDKKCALAERFNQTWERFYYKYIDNRPYQRNKQKVLDLVAFNYNRRPHSALKGLSPSQVTLDVASKLVKKELDEREALLVKKKKSRKSYSDPVRLGDTVRITKARGAFFKQYRGTFSKEVFVVHEIYSRPTAPTVTLYRVEDLLGEKVKGVFYRRQLQKVLLPDKPVISKILRKDKRRGYLVRLQNYPADYSLWLSRTEIRDGYGLADAVRLAT